MTRAAVTTTATEAAFQQMFISMWGNIPLLLTMIGGAVIFAAFLIALNTMLLNGRERRLEFGVLKALGFADLHAAFFAMAIAGPIVFALTAAMWGEITIKDGRAEQANFDTYRMLRFREMPKVEVVIEPVESTCPCCRGAIVSAKSECTAIGCSSALTPKCAACGCPSAFGSNR